MAVYYARKAGNVNATDVWATTPAGTAGDFFPTFTAADTLVANGFNVNLNVSVTVGEYRNAFSGATTGGTFVFNTSGVTATGDTSDVGTINLVSFSAGVNVTFVGTLRANSAVNGHSAIGNNATLTVVGKIQGGPQSWVLTASNCTINIVGDVVGGAGTRAAIETNNTGVNVNVTGRCIGGGGSPAVVIGHTNCTLNVDGAAEGNVGAGVSVTAASACFVKRAKGGPLASSAAGASAGVAGTLEIAEVEYGDLGASPTTGPMRLRDLSTNVALFYRPSLTKKTLVDPAAGGLSPSASNVRLGVSYNAGNTTGTCAVPAAASVLAGVPVDNTVGTAQVTSAAVQAACEAALAAFSGGRLATVATVASVGQQLADAGA